MYNIVSLALAILSVVLGLISIMLTLSVKSAVARTEKQIMYRNLKMDLSNRLYAITRDCTDQNIRLLHELLLEIDKDSRLPTSNTIKSSKNFLEYYIVNQLPADGILTSGRIVTDYQDAYASAKTFIDNIKIENP